MVDARQAQAALAQPGDHLVGEGLPRVQLLEGAFRIHPVEALQHILATGQGLQLEALHIQLEQRRRGDVRRGQGIGQALLENCVYDENGQLVSGSYMDYTMPRADNMPSFKVGQQSTLCTHNTLGVKGCGEVGAIGSPPAVINAVVDALAELGVTDIEMPATPEKVWRAINDARAQAAE